MLTDYQARSSSATVRFVLGRRARQSDPGRQPRGEHPPPTQPPRHPSGGATRMAESTLLVVDDEPRIVEFLAENLRADDYAVLTAATGAEAIELLGRARPDLVLLDVVLPDMSGYEICRTVRGGDGINDPWDPDLPIIMLSAKAEHVDRVRGLVRGADDYVTKPFHYPELLARIGGLLKRSQRVRDGHVIRVADLALNTLSREVTVGGLKVDLS